MKSFVVVFFVAVSSLSSNAQTCDEMLKQAYAAEKQGKYFDAYKKYDASLTRCGDSRKDEIEQKKQNVVALLEQQRDRAEKAEKEAKNLTNQLKVALSESQKKAKVAQSNALSAKSRQFGKEDKWLALRLAGEGWELDKNCESFSALYGITNEILKDTISHIPKIVLADSSGWFTSADYNLKANLFVTGSTSGEVAVWTNDGKKLNGFKVSGILIHKVKFSPDAKFIIATSHGAEMGGAFIEIWNLKGKKIKTIDLSEEYDEFYRLIVAPDNKHFLVDNKLFSYGDDEATDLDINGACTFTGNGNIIYINNGYFVIQGVDGKIVKQIKADIKDDEVVSISYFPNKPIITGLRSGLVLLLNENNGEILQSINTDNESLHDVDVDFNQSIFITRSVDGRIVKVFDYNSNKLLKVFTGNGSIISDLGICRVNNLVWIVDGYLKLFDMGFEFLDSQSSLPPMPGQLSVFSNKGYLLSPKGTYEIELTGDGKMNVYNKIIKKTTAILHSIDFNVNVRVAGCMEDHAINISGDEKLIIEGFPSGLVWIKNFDGQVINKFKAHNAGINAISSSYSGKYFATASCDSTVCVWDFKGNLIKKLGAFNSTIMSVVFSPDDKYLIFSGGLEALGGIIPIETNLYVYELSAWKLINKPGMNFAAEKIVVSPDNNFICTYDLGGGLRVYNTEYCDYLSFINDEYESYYSNNEDPRSCQPKWIGFTSDSKELVVKCDDEQILSWQLPQYAIKRTDIAEIPSILAKLLNIP